MTRAILGFIGGCVVTSLIVWFAILPQVRESYRAVGENSGAITAKWEISDLVASKVGSDSVVGEEDEVLFSIKTRDVVVVERHGVKTLRVKD